MRPNPRVGSQLGSYRIDAVLGRGGMGVVYLAEHLRLRKKIALKVLPPELAEDEDFRRRFERESQLAASLDHPNIVTVHDAGEVDGVLYIAMRYVEGSDLARRIREGGALPVDEVLDILNQAAEGLDEAHGKGLVHRDVKPANILLAASPRGGHRVYLSDFGLAREWAAAATRLTRSGLFVGTIHYSPPEQFRSEPLDGRTDVYSLGCVLFECLTGRVPFDRTSDPAVMYAHLQDPPPRVSSLRPDVPPAIDEVVRTAMAKPKEDRYPTCGELARAAGQVLRHGSAAPGPSGRRPLVIGEPPPERQTLAGAPPTVVTPPATEAVSRPGPQPSEPRRRASPWWWAAVAAVLAVGLGVGAFLALRREPGNGADGENGENGQTGPTRLLTPAFATSTSTAPPGVDACGDEVPFEVNRVIDGDATTAWRTPGNGVGEEITVVFNEPVRIVRIGLIPGYNKIDPCDQSNRFAENRVISRVEYTFPSSEPVTQRFAPNPSFQYVELDVETTQFTVVIRETEAQGPRDFTVISEIEVYGTPLG
jgi:serine/threonine protein kinase